MKYASLADLSDKEFRRLTGVKRPTFSRMLQILREAETRKKSKGGKPNALSMEDRLLMLLEYNREYRTYFHAAASCGVSESTCFRNIKWMEDALVGHPDLALPGKKELLANDSGIEIVLVDATESPVERPKKNSGNFIRAKKRNTR